jgi:hypothetical protein
MRPLLSYLVAVVALSLVLFQPSIALGQISVLSKRASVFSITQQDSVPQREIFALWDQVRGTTGYLYYISEAGEMEHVYTTDPLTPISSPILLRARAESWYGLSYDGEKENPAALWNSRNSIIFYLPKEDDGIDDGTWVINTLSGLEVRGGYQWRARVVLHSLEGSQLLVSGGNPSIVHIPTLRVINPEIVFPGRYGYDFTDVKERPIYIELTTTKPTITNINFLNFQFSTGIEYAGGPTPAGPTLPSIPPFIQGIDVQKKTPDFNGDGIVNFPDFVEFAKNFGKKQEDEGFDAKFDLNGDGIVNFPDFVEFAQAFGKPV